MAKDRTEEILDSLLNDIGIEVDEFIAQVHKREPVKAPSDELSPQKNDTPSLIPNPPKAGDTPTSPSGTKVTQPEFDSEDLKKTFAPKPKAPSGPEQASSPSGMSSGSGGSPDVQQSISGYDPNSKLPWFKHGMKGFFRKLWHGDHPENPSWQGYKAEQRLTLDECIFLNKQISEKVDQLSSQFLTEAVMTDYDDLVNSLKEKIASHFRQAVAEARQKGSNSRGAGRKSNLETLNDFLSQLGEDKSPSLEHAIGALKEKIDMEGWEFHKAKSGAYTLRKQKNSYPLGSKPAKNIIKGLISKNKSAEAALGTDSAASSAPTTDDAETGKGDDKPTTSGVVSKVKPISPPTSTDGGQTDAKAKKSLVRAVDIKNILKREYIAAAKIADLGEERKEFEYYAKILKSPLNVLEKNEKFKTDWQSEGENIEEALAKMFISDLGLNKTPKEILSMTKEELEKIVSDWHAQIPDKEEKKEPRKAYKPDPSKMGALDSDDFDDFEEGSSLDAYRATKILEQLNPHHKLMYYKKLLSCGVRMSSDKINLSEVKINEKVKYLKEKLHH